MPSTTIPQSHKVQALLQETVERILLPRFKNLAPSEIYKKGHDSCVTEADLDAEKFLTHSLSSLVDGSKVLGEEAIANSEAKLNEFSKEYAKKTYWLIDPLDGTRNFIKGSNIFCSMIAFVTHDKVRASWIYSHQEKSIIHAIENEGAFADNIPIPLTASKNHSNIINKKARGRISWTKKPLDYDTNLIERMPSVRCAGQDFVDLVLNKTDFAYYNSLWPWDHAPGGFILKSIGGRTADFNTELDIKPCLRTNATLATKSKNQWKPLQKALQKSNLM